MFFPCHLATVVPDDDGQRGHENEDRPYPDDVMNLKGSQRAATHGEMLHAPLMHTHVWATS